MSDILNLCDKYRPKVLKDVYGQSSVVSFFRSVVNRPEESPRYYGLFGAFGSGKCQAWDTWVKTSDGVAQFKQLVPISTPDTAAEIPSFYARVKGRDELIKLGYNSGYKPTRKLYCSTGFPVENTLVHPMLCWNSDSLAFEWKQTKDIKVGDILVHEVSDKLETQIKFHSDYYLLGLIAGDGSVTGSNQPTFMSTDEELLDFVRQNYSDSISSEVPASGNPALVSIRFKTDSYVAKLLSLHGYMGTNSKTKHVPLRANLSKQASFLQGLLDTDGSIKEGGLIELGSDSEELLAFASAVAGALGYVTKLHLRSAKHKGFRGRLYLHRTPFASFVPFRLTRKAEKFGLIVDYGQQKKYIFPGMNNLLQAKIEESGFKFTREDRDDHPWISNCRSTNQVVTSVWDAEKYFESRGFTVQILPRGWYPSVVENIVDSANFCYDITNEISHSYVGNSMVSHNTTIAKAFAATLIGENYRSTPNYIEIDSSEKKLQDNFDTVKDLIFQEVPGWKVVCVDECHLLPMEAQQQFLKILEDYVGPIFVFFCSTDPQLMFPPLLSRLHKFEISTFTAEQCKEYGKWVLEQEKLNISDKALSIAALNSQGHMRDMLKQCELILFQGEASYLENFSSIWKSISEYFFSDKTVEQLVNALEAHHPIQLRKYFTYFFREELLNPASPHYGKGYPVAVLPKLFMNYCKLLGNVKDADDFFSFLYVFRQVLASVMVRS